MNGSERAGALVRLLLERRLTVASAESCTGGLIAKLITDIPGSSAVFPGACVTYTNEIKIALLGIDPALIDRFTEVSPECARAMAENVRARLGADIGVSSTGFAGPGGGSEKDPVGTVYLAVSYGDRTKTVRFSATPGADREAVRNEAAEFALGMVLDAVREIDR